MSPYIPGYVIRESYGQQLQSPAGKFMADITMAQSAKPIVNQRHSRPLSLRILLNLQKKVHHLLKLPDSPVLIDHNLLQCFNVLPVTNYLIFSQLTAKNVLLLTIIYNITGDTRFKEICKTLKGK